MKTSDVVFTGLLAGLGAWVLVLLRHENRVRTAYRSRCMYQGVHWRWADPAEYGASPLFSIPQPLNLKTGEIEWVDLQW